MPSSAEALRVRVRVHYTSHKTFTSSTSCLVVADPKLPGKSWKIRIFALFHTFPQAAPLADVVNMSAWCQNVHPTVRHQIA